MQDIFERIDNYRGGEGKVKLKDLVLFLRGVYDNIDENFEVVSALSSSSMIHHLLIFCRGVYDAIGDSFDVVNLLFDFFPYTSSLHLHHLHHLHHIHTF